MMALPASAREEMAVISQGLLRQAIDEERNEEIMLEDDEVTIPFEEIPLKEAKSLRLSFKSLLKIDNLYSLQSLRRLQLDNNKLKKIENIQHLVHLEWLDLSFNRIEKIEGLSTLTALKDLSLYSNEIRVIENMDTNTALQCLSLGRNKIKGFEGVKYLRQLPELEVLRLSENPVAQDNDYKDLTIAHLKRLKYLDYKLITSEDREAAREKAIQNEDFMELETKEQIEQAGAERARSQQEWRAKLERANLLPLEDLFDAMFKNDPEQAKLRLLPRFEQIKEDYREKFTALLSRYHEEALQRSLQREQEIEAFSKTKSDILSRANTKMVVLVHDYKKNEKRYLNEYFDNEHVDGTFFNPLRNHARHLSNRLMEIELGVHEKLLDIIGTCESSISELYAKHADKHREFFKQVQSLESLFHESIIENAELWMKKVADNEMGENLSDETLSLLHDRESLMQAITASSESHTEVIVAVDDKLVVRDKQKMKSLSEEINKAETSRNREKVLEIQKMLRNHLNIIESEAGDADLDDDF